MRQELETAIARCIEGVMKPGLAGPDNYMAALLVLYELAGDEVSLAAVEDSSESSDRAACAKIGVSWRDWYEGYTVKQNCALALELYAKRYPEGKQHGPS